MKSNVVGSFLKGLDNKKVEFEFSGETISSNGGSVLLRQADKSLNLLNAVAEHIIDPRDQSRIHHSLHSLLQQRVYGLALGYEDLNDHDFLREDPVLQISVERSGESLGSSPTLCRFDSYADRQTIIGVHQILVERWISSYASPPKEIVLDFDPTDIPLHGNQENRHYHKYYGEYCYLPLQVFCGDDLLITYLRSSDTDPAKHVWAILALLVKRIRKEWPEVSILFRADSGLCRHRIFDWCEKNKVDYLTGMTGNAVLQKKATLLKEEMKKAFEATQEKQKGYTLFSYGAGTWSHERTMVCKVEHNAKGNNTRFLVTNLSGTPQELYEKQYCPRGKMELRIGEQIDFFLERASSSTFMGNAFRLVLSGLAYTLVQAIRKIALAHTEMETSLCKTIRLKLLKIGAIVMRNTRRIRIILPKSYPDQGLFFQVTQRLAVE